MTVAELIATLQEIPSDWETGCTSSGGIAIYELGDDGDRWRVGRRYGYVYPDGRPTIIFTRRR